MTFLCNTIVFFFSAALTLDTIHLAVSEHEPLYFIRSEGETYTLASDVWYNHENKHLTIRAEDDVIYEACPKHDDKTSFEIVNVAWSEMEVSISCEHRIQSQIYSTKNDAYQALGYAVYIPNRELFREFSNVPEDHAFLNLIDFVFSKKLKRIEFVWYALTMGKLLKPEISHKDNKQYEKDEEHYGYDIDELYTNTSLQIVKMQLAPEEDFFFNNWKSSLRHNILTAPMWSELVEQWQNLEIYIRKITKVINSVLITTGVLDISTSSNDSFSAPYIYKGRYQIPRYFWKSISIDFSNYNKEAKYGIIFVMHNVTENSETNDISTYASAGASAEPEEEKICTPYTTAKLHRLGWKFFDKKKLKSLMYACPLSEKNMEKIEISLAQDHSDFNLRSVPTLAEDADGNDIIKTINVFEVIRQKDKEENNANQKPNEEEKLV